MTVSNCMVGLKLMCSFCFSVCVIVPIAEVHLRGDNKKARSHGQSSFSNRTCNTNDHCTNPEGV